MSGCYGNDPEDRYFERMLNDYLDPPDREKQMKDEIERAEYLRDQKREEENE